MFYVGDGTYNTQGDLEQIAVPVGATQLFLGFVDGPDFQGPPGYYSDNAGSIRATARFYAAPPPPPTGNLLGGSASWGGFNLGATTNGCVAADPVSCSTGNFFETTTDLTVTGRGRQLILERTYNAQDAASAGASGAFGWGWSGSYGTTRADIDAWGRVTIHQDNGSTVEFSPVANGYTTAPYVTATLLHNTSGTYTYTLKDQTADVFSAAGQLITESDRDGYATSLGYTGGRVSSVTDSAGRALSFVVDGSGRITKVSDPAGRIEQYRYDSAGNLSAAVDPAGNATAYAYDASHRMTTRTDPDGKITTNSYDAANRVVIQSDPAGGSTTFAYQGGVTAITDPDGRVRADTFDANGNLVSMTKGVSTPSPATLIFTYDTANNMLTSTDANGHKTIYTWDGRGNRLTRTDPLGNKTTVAYNAANDPTSVSDPLGVTTAMTYNAGGHLTAVATPVAPTGPIATTVFSYDAAQPGDLIGRVDPTGRAWRYTYTTNGDRRTTSDPAGDTTSFAYNPIGWLTATVSPRGNQPGANPASYATTYAHDLLGDLLSVTDPLGHTSSSTYDADRNAITTTDANGLTTRTGYDTNNRPASVTRPDGSVLRTAYDADGNVVSQMDGLGHTTTYSYDPLGPLASRTDPLQRSTTYTHDGAGDLLSMTDPLGRTTTYGYDADNQRTLTSYSDGVTPSVRVTYDAAGQQTAAYSGGVADTLRSGTWLFTYDALHRLTSSSAAVPTGAAAIATTYGYDTAGRVTSIGYSPTAVDVVNSLPNPAPDKSVNRAYDTGGRMSGVTDWLGHIISFGYDANSNLTTETFPTDPINGQPRPPSIDTFTYNTADQMTGVADSGPNGALASIGYTRDANGQLTSVSPTVAPSSTSPPAATTYGYDPTNRLISASVDAATTSAGPTWAYDNGDNVIGTTLGAIKRAYSYDAANEITSLAQTASPGLAAQTYTFTYDGNGNRTSGSSASGITTSYGWDQQNRLTDFIPTPNTGTITGPTGTVLTQQGGQSGGLAISYGPDNLRTDLRWDRAEGTPLVISDGPNQYITGPRGLPVELINDASQALFFHHDQLGSTTALTTPQGAIAESYIYSPYGQATPSNTAVINPFQYAGQYTDAESGLIYLRNRYYDPATGQFLSRDPVVALTRSAYGYVSNNPLNGTDPSGLDANGGTSGGPPSGEGYLAAQNRGQAPCPLNGYDISNLLPDIGGYLQSLLNGGPVWPGGHTAAAIPVGASAEQARNAANTSGFDVPADAVAEPASPGPGWVFRSPGSQGNANTVRVMEPTAQYPNGYIRTYNASGQPLNAAGQPGSKAETHFELPPDPEIVP
ncbi:MAG: RHS repeat-associated core domain-containing protein [Acidimicrobiales bacterium]